MKQPERNRAKFYHADLVYATVDSNSSAAQSTVAASWRRSLLYHQLDPEAQTPPSRVGELALREARERLGKVIAIAGPVMDRLFNAVGRAGYCLVFTDCEGLIVDRRSINSDDDSFAELGLTSGAVWSEATEGTNGIGTCIAEQRPVAILRDQHFRSRHTTMSCLGAPIFDSHANLCGVLDISSCRNDIMDVVPLVSTVIADAARQIERQAFRAAFPDCRIIVAPAHGHRGEALLAVDDCELVIGATRLARQSLNLPPNFRARPITDVLAQGRQSSDLRAAARAELRRALARANGNASAAARELGLSTAAFYSRLHRAGLKIRSISRSPFKHSGGTHSCEHTKG